MDDKDIEKVMVAAEANLIAQGYITQDDNGLLNFTEKGMKRAEQIIEAMPEEDLALITGYFKMAAKQME